MSASLPDRADQVQDIDRAPGHTHADSCHANLFLHPSTAQAERKFSANGSASLRLLAVTSAARAHPIRRAPLQSLCRVGHGDRGADLVGMHIANACCTTGCAIGDLT